MDVSLGLVSLYPLVPQPVTSGGHVHARWTRHIQAGDLCHRLRLAPQPRPSSAFSQPPSCYETPRLPICRNPGPAMPIMHRGFCLVIIVLLNIPTSSCFLSLGLARLAHRSCAATGRGGASLCGLRAQVDGADGGEWALTNDQCDLLELPRGTKMVFAQPDPPPSSDSPHERTGRWGLCCGTGDKGALVRLGARGPIRGRAELSHRQAAFHLGREETSSTFHTPYCSLVCAFSLKRRKLTTLQQSFWSLPATDALGK